MHKAHAVSSRRRVSSALSSPQLQQRNRVNFTKLAAMATYQVWNWVTPMIPPAAPSFYLTPLEPPAPIKLFRGVPQDHVTFEFARLGIALPRRLFWNVNFDIVAHNHGSRRSPFTSWTRDRSVAETFASPKGVILEASIQPNRIRWSPDLWWEMEAIVTGAVFGASVTEVNKTSSNDAKNVK